MQPPNFQGRYNIDIIYFKTMEEFPWVIVPAIASGIDGIIVGSKLLAFEGQQRPIRSRLT